MDNKLYVRLKKIIINWVVPILVFLLVIFICTVKLPWSVYAPGGLIDVSERINSDKISNNYFLTYVSFIDGTIPSLALAYVLPSWDIVKNSTITLENEDMIDASRRDKIALKESVSNAMYVAYEKSGNKVNIVKKHAYITYVFERDTTEFRVGDELISYDNHEFTDFNVLNEYVKTKDIGDEIKVVVNRDNKERELNVSIRNIEGDAKLGISMSIVYDYDNTPNLEYQTKKSESGSSGGFMLALALYDILSDEDIAKNRKISGTGTISLDGTVGEIGGVKYKLAGAVKNKADIFLVPSANYEEAIKVKNENKYDIEVIEAKNFDQVIEALRN